jgi:hypothetical protein
MSYSIEISENENYILILAKSDITVEMARQWTSELVELSNKSGITNYLFDARKRKNISNVTENYNFSYKDVGLLNYDKTHRSAMLVDPDDHSHDFVETTMINAGYNAKIFHDESEAIKWLEG